MASIVEKAGVDQAAPASDVRTGGAYRWYVVFVLFLAYSFSAIDARVLTLLVVPIKRDLQLSDFEISLLQGFAFAILYSLAAIPIGRFVDTSLKRTRLVVGGVLFWSAMTMVCGMVRSFGALFAARVGVGVGEATLSPSAYSLISDYFDRGRRALAISFYAIGYPIGSGLALILGAALLDHFTARGPIEMFGLGAHQPWQMVFIAVGLPGLLIAALVMTIREPERRELTATHGTRMPLSAVFVYLGARWQLYGMLLGSTALIALLAIGTSVWYPTFLIRTYGMSTAEVGFYFGTVMLVCGTIGTLTGGWFAGRLVRRGQADANMRIVLVATILKGVPLVIGPLMPTPQLALAFIALGTLVGQASQGVLLAAIQDVTPNQLRGQVTALTLLGVNLVGMGLGGSVIAAITQFGFADEGALRYSIAITGAVVLPLIVLLIVAGMPAYRRGLQEMMGASTE
ncbi:MFS transporter [Sphingomonas sanxanigenens]|nr:MFS transporter [Sphingomonas sanxanigenens]